MKEILLVAIGSFLELKKQRGKPKAKNRVDKIKNKTMKTTIKRQDIKVKSFVTKLPINKVQTLKGGAVAFGAIGLDEGCITFTHDVAYLSHYCFGPPYNGSY